MNTAPSTVDCDEENGVSSPNSTVSSISGKRSEREPIGEETEAERASCSRGSDDEDGGGAGDASRKKLRLSKEQSFLLEETFKEHNTLNPVSGNILWQFLMGLCLENGLKFVNWLIFSCRSKSWLWQSS